MIIDSPPTPSQGTTYYLAGLRAPVDFLSLSFAAGFGQDRNGYARPCGDVDDILKYNSFWSPMITGYVSYENYLDDWPLAPLLAGKLIVHRALPWEDTDLQLEQDFYPYAAVWSELIRQGIVHMTEPTDLEPSAAGDIFRNTTVMMRRLLENLPRSFVGELDPIELRWILGRWTAIVADLLFARELRAVALWPKSYWMDVRNVLQRIEQLAYLSEDIDNEVVKEAARFESALAVIPSVDLIVHEGNYVRAYPENVQIVAELRDSEELASLRVLIDAASPSPEWRHSLEEVGRSLRRRRIRRSTLSVVGIAAGIGLGVAGLVYRPAGIAGVSLAV